MKNISSIIKKSTVASVALFAATIFATSSPAQTVFVDQGPDWTSETRAAFYVQDQGSRIMPLSWMRALKQSNGDSFMADSLARFGYLPNPDNGETDIPVGFTTAKDLAGKASIGMTCSACHTREIDVNGTQYRLDGGPAIVDFQDFLLGIDQSINAVLQIESEFVEFAAKVLGSSASDTKVEELKLAVDAWYIRYHTLIERSLTKPGWGPSRLDAVSMIFNRLTGLDIGEDHLHLIPDNIYPANAPVRYPFLWNAARQDKTQWPGFADNGNAILGLARNLGEVYGVFGEFHPVKENGFFELNRNYLTNNSANFDGLKKLEDLIWKIGPPKWPWQLKPALVAKGKQIYNRSTDENGCQECHGIKTGAIRSPFHRTWATPILDVGTDAAECKVLARTVDTGIMEGAKIPLAGGALGKTEPAFKVLTYSVLGSIIQNATRFMSNESLTADANINMSALPEFQHLKGAFRPIKPLGQSTTESVSSTPKSGCAYESRVMQGIWAAAPYLHNGSVATLTDLLKAPSKRAASFKLGPNYDIETVGLAVEQTKFDYVLNTTDCSDLLSGNSRCGHLYGTELSADDKTALLEYLKSL